MPEGDTVSDAPVSRLITELDKRLKEQGYGQENYIEVLVDYLRDGWVLLALPKDVVDLFDSRAIDNRGQTIAELATELRSRLAKEDGS